MEQLYKGHHVQVLAGLDGANWITCLRVFSQKGATHTLLMFAMNQQFATYDAVIQAGFTAGRNWVDDIELQYCSKTTRLCTYSRRLREKSRSIQQISRYTAAKSRTIVDKSLTLYLQVRSSARPRPLAAYPPLQVGTACHDSH